jgi:hypothetical protein
VIADGVTGAAMPVVAASAGCGPKGAQSEILIGAMRTRWGRG